MADNARLTRITGLPRPFKFKSIEDATKAQEELYRALSEWRVDIPRPNQLMSGLIFRPEWYGAVGDGVTDDTAAIQATIDAAEGGTVVFSEKIYAISATLNLKSCSSYIGPLGGSFTVGQEHPSSSTGACLKWIGSASDIMVQAYSIYHVHWAGVDLDGVDSADGITGIYVSGDNSPSFQHGHFHDFRIFNCAYGMKIGDYSGGTDYQADHIKIDHFQFYLCTTGIYVNSQNAMDFSTITNGQLTVGDVGIHLERCGYLRASNLAVGYYTNSPTTGALVYIGINGPLVLENIQGEPAGGVAGTGWVHIKTASGVGTYSPITVTANKVDCDISINDPRKITFIGNYFGTSSVNLVGNSIRAVSIDDYFTTGDFAYTGSGNSVVFIHKDINGGHEYISHNVDGTEVFDVDASGNVDVTTGYKVGGTTYVNQALTASDSPTFSGLTITNNIATETIGATSFISAAGTTENLTDGAFENWASATNLTSWGESISGSASVNRESTSPHGGTYCVRIDSDGGANAAYIWQDISLVASRPYILSFWYKASAGKLPWIYFFDTANNRWLTSDGSWSVSEANFSPTASESWAQFVLPFTAHSSYSEYRLQIYFQPSASGSAYFDDASLTTSFIFGGSASLVNQDVTTTAGPTFDHLHITNDIDAGGVYKVDGTQVVSNRVVDADFAKTPNSGDADTDTLIDKIRDALITHGLIASS